jgi:transportin-1
MKQLVPLIQKENLIPSLLENTAITIGRIALVCPTEVSAFLQAIGPYWCLYLSRIREATEKELAFRALCQVCRALVFELRVFPL